MGYQPRKNAPSVQSGIYKGMLGVLCWRPGKGEPKRLIDQARIVKSLRHEPDE